VPQRNSGARRIDTEALKRERPLVDVVASYGVALRRESGGTYRALCPFHQERTPSFWIDMRGDASSHHYFCFGCGAHGDSITFVMERESCSFPEACERLSTRGRRPVVEPVAKIAEKVPGRDWEELSLESVEVLTLDVALRIYEMELWRNDRAQAYLRKRGVREEVARAQRLGYANGHALVRQLTGPNLDLLSVAIEIGLVLERSGSGNGYPQYREFFFDRLIIPELRHGRPIWTIGRAVDDAVATGDDSSAASRKCRATSVSSTLHSAADSGPVPRPRARPKYLGLPGEKPIMGLERVRGRRSAFIVEGPFDFLAAMGWGLPAFAICGTHFPSKRLPSLDEARVIYGVFDPDRAGRSAAERFAPLFGSRWRPIRLPNSLDLAELAALGATGRETFEILVGRARGAAWERSQAV
jgi:DNA primase